MRVFGLLSAFLIGLAAMGCATPQHYSVGVATSQNYITYAQRHHDVNHNDYLVDCKLDAKGQRSDCYTVELQSGAWEK